MTSSPRRRPPARAVATGQHRSRHRGRYLATGSPVRGALCQPGRRSSSAISSRRSFGELPIGQWRGPVSSTYGTHLVLVDDRTDSRVPALEEVRDVVRRDWANAQRTEASEKYYQVLLRRYTVTVEPAQPVMATENVRRTGRCHETSALRSRDLALAFGRLRARSAPGLPPDTSDWSRHLRCALESPGTRRRHAAGSLCGAAD